MSQSSAFTDHGVVAEADQDRTAGIVRGPDGTLYFVIGAKGYVLTIDLNRGSVRQTAFPEGHVQYPFASLVSRAGKFYTGAGSMFMEFDPVEARFTHHAHPCLEELNMAFSIAESPDGLIYFASHPSCRLFCFDPETQDIRHFGRMDEAEKYVGTMAVDADGWVYLGIGTERHALVGFDPRSGTRQEYVQESARGKGCGCFHLGIDGQVYGRDRVYMRYEPVSAAPDCQWRRYRAGTAEEVAASNVSPAAIYPHAIHSPFIDGDIIRHYSLQDHELVYTHPQTGREVQLELTYKSHGAMLCPLAAGPDGNVYGTSGHPLHLYRFNPATGQVTDFGSKVAGDVAGSGNICAYASQGSIMVGAHYSGGHILRFDLTKPFEPRLNPALEATCEDIHRPRSAIAHPDGQRLVFGGFAGYGAVGGALCIYDVVTRQHSIIPNETLVPYQSTMCMAFAANNDLLGGASIETPGGAQPKAAEAEIYRFDLDARRLVYRTVPIAGAREISHFLADRQGLLHGITSDSVYFVFDPETSTVLHREDVSRYGSVVRAGMTSSPDGLIYGVLSEAVYCIDPERREFKLLATPPETISAGLALVAGTIVFASGAHLWSLRLPWKRRRQNLRPHQ